MEDRLRELYRGVAVHATADREHMAALELLALVMLADADDIQKITRRINGGLIGLNDRINWAKRTKAIWH